MISGVLSILVTYFLIWRKFEEKVLKPEREAKIDQAEGGGNENNNFGEEFELPERKSQRNEMKAKKAKLNISSTIVSEMCASLGALQTTLGILSKELLA